MPEHIELDAFAFDLNYDDGDLYVVHTCGHRRKIGYPASIGVAVLRASQHVCEGPGQPGKNAAEDGGLVGRHVPSSAGSPP